MPPGDVIAEIETDKATMEVEAVDEGTVAKILVPEGTEAVKVNALIAVLAGDGEDTVEAAKAAGDGAGSAPKPRHLRLLKLPRRQPLHRLRQPLPHLHRLPRWRSTDREQAGPLPSPLARRIAKDAGIDVAAITGTDQRAGWSKPISKR